MTIRVLIADDHAILREGLAKLLSGHPDLDVVGAASNGLETVRKVVECRPDVVILDVAMPDMNGIEATRRIHERFPETGVVILSMHASPEFVFRALEAGARGYMDKDSVGAELVSAVRAVHAGRRYLSERVADVVAEGVQKGRYESPLDQLSAREREILQLVAEGNSSAEIGRKIGVSPKTVDTYRSRLMQKLRLDDVAGVVKFAISHGLVSLD